jgi:hypothetical protein
VIEQKEDPATGQIRRRVFDARTGEERVIGPPIIREVKYLHHCPYGNLADGI